ncbi:cytochrome-c oxidase, cbb3-type subunit III [Bordetella genomosp. 9]|uniref:Cbb3-type cytochrome c oxidase subunit n=1 Tax=Bordetella genomosp. 9 TaxID=1416803 RepID=A0A261R3E6_9BORD|nr:cytochrome-c oxidase, cbb3-type subunit III [Bordetella genomosp. 9]OZI18853.1 cytochrome-c oxidase, cbb3-type subunit III [Bordetella genomosp. 9]
MSDFTTPFWGYFVGIIAMVGIVWCLWLLYTQRRWLGRSNAPPRRASGLLPPEGALLPRGGPAAKDAYQPADTGHVWDGDLTELNNPVPRWWTVMYLLMCLFAVGYLLLFPGLGHYAGTLGYTSADDVRRQQEAQDTATRPLYARYEAMPVPEIARDSRALEIGQRLFLNNCAQCHGSDAKGAPGFPNLTDGDWLYGGAPETILQTITKGRHGVMPAWSGTIDARTASDLADYVRSLSGLGVDRSRIFNGKDAYATYCVACHGVDAKGNQALGAPNLTDDVWLYGSSQRTIEATILNGRDSRMPAQEGVLTPAQIRILTAWVWRQSNGNANGGGAASAAGNAGDLARATASGKP